jgi:hypothetical protein
MPRTVDKSESQELITTPNGTMPASGQLVPAGATTIVTILDRAVAQEMPPESLEKIVALYERVADRNAAQECAASLAAFQAECPIIGKNRTAQIPTRNGGSYSFQYADLDGIASTIRPLLHKHGLSYSWDSVVENGQITCTAIVRHVNGHSFSAKFTCPTASASAMSDQQKNASALTFARRQSLVQVLGLTTGDPDTDGAPDAGEKITDHELANLKVLIDEVKQDVPRFLKWAGVARLDDIPADKVGPAFHFLESKRGGK